MNTPQDVRVHIAREDFGRDYAVYIIEPRVDHDGNEKVAHVNAEGNLVFDAEIEHATVYRNPTFRFSGIHAFRAMRELAMALAQLGFYDVNPESKKQHEEHAAALWATSDTLKDVVEKQHETAKRQLDIIEKLVQKSEVKAILVPQGTDFRAI